MSEYEERDPWRLEPHYSKHVGAMTREGLHEKAAIAAELAFRDKEIERLSRLLQKKRQEMRAAKDAEWNAFMAGLGPSRWER